MRRSAPTVDAGRRTGITEVEEVMTPEHARSQAERCLSCHVDTIYDPLLCVLCNRCADVCPEKCLTFVPLDRVDMPAELLQALLVGADEAGDRWFVDNWDRLEESEIERLFEEVFAIFRRILESPRAG
jgi:ferredoxin